MAKNPKIGGTMRMTNVNLVLGPKGIALDEHGRISFKDAEIEQAMVTGVPDGQDPEVSPMLDINYKCNVGCNPKLTG